jgi:hypothetical protein
MNESITFYIFAVGLVIIASIVGNKFKQSFSDEHNKDEYEMVKQYLLNDSPLYGYNRPKLWIHSKYEMNARKWKNFQSRNTTDLNQPYLYLTIQTIVNHCGDDFHVCLIDDDTFTKLIPTWDLDVKNISDPMKSQIREIGMLQLVYYYGGMIVPNSFLCTKNLIHLYNIGTQRETAFVSENINRHVNIQKEKHRSLFIPDIEIMGAPKHNECVKECIELLKQNMRSGHFTFENEFLGTKNQFCIDKIKKGEIHLVDGEYIGIKSRKGKQIVIDDLMEESFLDIDSNKIYGIQIPRDELLKRTKFKWFTILPYKDILESNVILSKFFKSSMVDSADTYLNKKTNIKSVISI